MFERYTERARRVIFFARYETSAFGSTIIETEHLLLGLLREETNLLQRVLERPDIHEEMRARIKSRSSIREKIPTSMDLPLSEECRRILKYAEEEAERMGHGSIGIEHLLLGILQEKGCLAEQLLSEAGVSVAAVREAIGYSSPQERPLTAEAPPSVFHSSVDERNCWTRRMQDGSIVVVTRQSIGPHQISVKEQFQLGPDGRKLRYTHEVTGPMPEQRHVHSYEFDVP